MRENVKLLVKTKKRLHLLSVKLAPKGRTRITYDEVINLGLDKLGGKIQVL